MYDITVFGAEPHPNYNRILLSPVLAGEQTIEDIILNDLDWYAENNITLHPESQGRANRPPEPWCMPKMAPPPNTTACCWPPAPTRSSCRFRARTCKA
jgi:hypothetical protein